MKEKDRVQYKFYVPAELKKKLEHHAIDNNRSLSSEIITRLESTIRQDEILDSPIGHITIIDEYDDLLMSYNELVREVAFDKDDALESSGLKLSEGKLSDNDKISGELRDGLKDIITDILDDKEFRKQIQETFWLLKSDSSPDKDK